MSTLEYNGVEYRLDKTGYQDALIILEVPCQGASRALLVRDEAEYCQRCEELWGEQDLSDYDEYKGLPPFQYWLKVNGHALRHQDVFTIDEAIDALALEAFGSRQLLEVLRQHSILTPVATGK